MFIQLQSGKLINLNYLDDVEKRDVLNTQTEVTTYQVVFIMINGTQRIDEYDNESDRNTAYDKVITKLIK